MWEKILAVNSFVFWPISVIFFLYAVGRLIFAWDWKLLVIAFIFVTITSVIATVLAIIIET